MAFICNAWTADIYANFYFYEHNLQNENYIGIILFYLINIRKCCTFDILYFISKVYFYILCAFYVSEHFRTFYRNPQSNDRIHVSSPGLQMLFWTVLSRKELISVIYNIPLLKR